MNHMWIRTRQEEKSHLWGREPCWMWSLSSDERWKNDPFMVRISIYTEEGHLRRVCVFLKGDHWPHTSLLAVAAAAGPAEGI